MARAFRRKGRSYVASLDQVERQVVTHLMEQTRTLLAAPYRPSTGDPFADLVEDLERAAPPQGEPSPGQEVPGGPGTGRSSEPGGGLGAARAGGDEPGDADAPGGQDPALRRLLPDAHHDDPAIAAEFRAMTERGLRERKSANLSTAIDALRAAQKDTVRLDLAQARATVVALTDVRLLLGERLGLRTDEDAEKLGSAPVGDPQDPATALVAYYEFLTWLQESLSLSLLR